MKVYCLSLPKSEKRKEWIQGQMDKFGLDFYWVAGADREEMRWMPENYDPAKAQRDLNRQMGIGEIGCLIGHLRAFQAIIDSGEEWGIVIEDDAIIYRHPVEVFEKAARLAGDEGKLILGSKAQGRRTIRKDYGDHIFELSSAPVGAYCYAIHRKFAARAIVHLVHSLHLPIDIYFLHQCRIDPHGFWQAYGVAEEHRIGQTSVIGDEARCHHLPETHHRKLEILNVCPALIHQVWFGPKKIPVEMESWAAMNPGHIHRLWTAKEAWPILKEYGMDEIWTSYMQDECYMGAADVARYCILHKFGGMYADADSEALRPLDIQSEFLTYESERFRPGLITNAFLQLKARHPIMLDLIKRIKSLEHPVPYERCWVELGPQLLTTTAERYKINVLPAALFNPVHFKGKNNSAGVAPYATHHFDGTASDAKVPEARREKKEETISYPKWLSPAQ